MKRNLRMTVGCLSVLVLLLVFGLTFWWVQLRSSGPEPGYGEDSPPSVR